MCAFPIVTQFCEGVFEIDVVLGNAQCFQPDELKLRCPRRAPPLSCADRDITPPENQC
jgi:hypothetical protein